MGGLRPARLPPLVCRAAVSLRTQLTIAFLVLTLVPSAVVSFTAWRQIVQVNALWESAGFETPLRSSVNVARRSLERMQYDLENAAGPLVERWRDAPPDLENDAAERLYVTRFLDDVGFDFVHVYAPTDRGLALVSDVHPGHAREHPPIFVEEVAAHIPEEGPLESSQGVFAYVHDVAGGRRVVVGYILDPNFFLDLSEVRLGMGLLNALTDNARLLLTSSIILIVSLLVAVALLAVFGGWFLSLRLAGPVSELSHQLETMAPGPTLQAVTEPRHASREVHALTAAFNALTGRLRSTQQKLLRSERLAGSAMVARHVAHEIKNPLSTLGLATRRLGRRLETLAEADRVVARDSLAAMRKEFELLEEMAETFSELGRMAEPLSREPLELNVLVRSVHVLHEGGSVRFELDLTPGLPPIQADEKALRRVLSNLVKNAVEAQSGSGRVTVRTSHQDGRVILAVEDDGPGIPEEVRARVFEPGFSTKQRGSGVGLFLARALVEQHGGHIEIDTETGKGTVVRVTLPAGRQDSSIAGRERS